MLTNRPVKLLASIALLWFALPVYAVDAPAPIVDEGVVTWSSVNAISINVHSGDGEYLETLPGDATRWNPSESGDYFFVATDSGDWRNWGRSEIVSVITTSNTVATATNINDENPGGQDSFISDARAVVYSGRAAELFWQPNESISNVRVEITRTDNTGASSNSLTDGRSFFDSTLQPGTTYNYTLRPSDSFGNVGAIVTLEITTPGEGVASGSTTGQSSTPAEIDAGFVPMSPQNLIAEVYSANALELFWDHASDFANNAIEYHVFQDGQEIGTTTGTSFFVDALAQGTTFNYSVEAVANALNSSAPATVTATTQGFPVFVIPNTEFGRPSDDRDTHRFETWDLISDEEASRWPSDCLFAVRNGAGLGTPFGIVRPEACFSPSSRFLIHHFNFFFPLPGDNATNHIEVVEWLHASRMGLIADITTVFGETEYEVSFFNQSGAFEGTFPILESIAGSDPGGNARAINLDGKDVTATVSVFDRSRGFFVNELIVIAEYWEALPGQDTSELSGWRNEGAFVSWLDPWTGEARQTTYFTGRSAESITEAEIRR